MKKNILISNTLFNNKNIKNLECNMEYFDNITLDEFEILIKKSDVIILEASNKFANQNLKNLNNNCQIILFDNILSNDDAYDLLISLRASLIILDNGNSVIGISKEKSVINLNKGYSKFLQDLINDRYYSTKIIDKECNVSSEEFKILHILNLIKEQFIFTGKYMFGTIAIRIGNTNSFVTSIRGKEDFSEFCVVFNVDNENLIVESNKKATLNAPLLFNIFKENPKITTIIHTHKMIKKVKNLKYAFPGSERDSKRKVSESFNIDFHGSFKLIK